MRGLTYAIPKINNEVTRNLENEIVGGKLGEVEIRLWRVGFLKQNI